MAWLERLFNHTVSMADEPDLEKCLLLSPLASNVRGRSHYGPRPTTFAFWRSYWEHQHDRPTALAWKARRIEAAQALSTNVSWPEESAIWERDCCGRPELEEYFNRRSMDKWIFSLDGQAGSADSEGPTSGSRRASDAGGHCSTAGGHSDIEGSLLVEVKVIKSAHQQAQEMGHNGKLVVAFYGDGQPSRANVHNGATQTDDTVLTEAPSPPTTAPGLIPASGSQCLGSPRPMCQQLHVAPIGKSLVRLFRRSNNQDSESRGLFISMSGKVTLTDTDFGDIEELTPEYQAQTEVSHGWDHCATMEDEHKVTEVEDLAAKEVAERSKFENDGRE